MSESDRSEEGIFFAACSIAEPANRAAFLDSECRGDADKRHRLDALLAARAEADDFFNRPPAGARLSPAGAAPPSADIGGSPDAPAPTLPVPTRARSDGETNQTAARRFGDYELLEEIARGGMGVVYRARQGGLDRTVALKMIASGHLASPSAVLRFRAEAEAAAQLDHPNIVPVYEVGERAGQHYFTMKLVEGRSLAEHIRRGDFVVKPGDAASLRAGMRRIVRLMSQVADAVHYAHQHGILHRDLKPSNILIDAAGQPHITDFGLAKRVESDSDLTVSGDVMGTPAYMAPEQAAGRMRQMTTTADVYSLGVILYELLAGRAPFRGTTALETLDLVRHSEPTAPRVANAALPRDLETICLKCLEKDPAKRYPSAGELAAELNRFLLDEPILARPVARTEKVWRWCRRQPALATMVATVALLLVSVSIISTIAARRATAARDAEVRERRAVEVAHTNELKLRLQAETAQQDAINQRNAAVKANEAAQRHLADAHAMMDFLKDKILAATRPKGQAGGLGREVTVRRAVEAAEPQIALLFTNRPLVEATIREALGTTYKYLGESAESIKQLERVLAVRKDLLGPDQAETVIAMNNLASAYEAAGRIKEALPLYEEALRRQKARTGLDDPKTLVLMHNLAITYNSLGREKEALELMEETVKRRKAVLGADHPDTLRSMNNLALAYQSANRSKEALPLVEEVLTIRKTRSGPEHPDTLYSMQTLASLYLDLGRSKEAVPLFEEALKLQKAVLGPEHRFTLSCMSELADAYQTTGRLGEALPLFEESLKLRQAKLGSEHPDTLRAMHALAKAYLAADRTREALPLFEETLKVRKIRLGTDHPNTLDSMHYLAKAYQASGRLDEAVALYEETLKLRRGRNGPKDPETLHSIHTLAKAYRASNRLPEALPLFEEAANLSKVIYGPTHPATLGFLEDLASASRAVEK